MTHHKEEPQGVGWKMTHRLSGDASHMPAWLQYCVFKGTARDTFVLFLLQLGNTPSEGKSRCAWGDSH